MLRQNEIFYNKVKWLLKERKRTVGPGFRREAPSRQRFWEKLDLIS